MTLKNYSNKNFLTMFKQSMKQVCVFPIIAFIIGLFPCINDFYIYKIEARNTIPDVSAVFFNEVHEGAVFLIFAAILSAVISALILFSFQWSKKQCNVIYSLGMSRDRIYTAKMLGGIIPMTGAALALTLVETFVNLLCNFTVDLRYWKMVFYLMPSFLVVYILAFVLCSVVFANTGNLIEGTVFTAIIAPFTMVFDSFLQSCLRGYTLGASNNIITWPWKWAAPFLAGQESRILDNPMYYGVNINTLTNYFSLYTDHNELHFLDYSLIITTIIYIAVLFTLGFFAFRKHKNEIAGTWGRSKGMTEIAGAVTGFYAFDFALMFNDKSSANEDNNFFDFIFCCLAFIVVMIIFKLIFSTKRKAAVKQTLNRFPAYVAVMGVITLIFSLGCFGYSSKVPELSEVKSVSVSSALYKYNYSFFADSSYYGLKRMNDVDKNSITETSVKYSDKTDIDEILKLHKAIITDGKIKGKAIDGCGCPIEIIYKLKNGKEITRSYSQTTTDTVKKIMMLNDLTASKKELERILNNYENITTTEDNLNEYFDDDVEIKDGEIFSKINGDNLGSISGDTFIDGNTGEEISLEDIQLTVFDNTMINYYLLNCNCYLYPKDMTRGFNIGKADKELCSALRKDIAAQSTADYFFHKSADEIGVISIGFSSPPVNDLDNDTGYYIGENGQKVYIDSYGNEIEMTNEDAEKVGQYVDTCAWNIYSNDIRAIVVTKNMTNTLKYLESHGMMKYFENSRKASDIKAVKLATPIELYDPNHTSCNLPVFAAGYWSGEYIREWEQGYDERYGSHFDVLFGHYFEKINNQITDTNTIKKLLESSVLFGFCGNDYRIMEIEYEDGSIGTTVITASAYKEIVK